MVLFAVRGIKNLIATFDNWKGFTITGELYKSNGGTVDLSCNNKIVSINNESDAAITIITIVM